MTSGTSGSIRKTEELSITTAPAAAARGDIFSRKIAAGAEECDVDTREGIALQFFHRDLFASEAQTLAGGARGGEQSQIADRKRAALEHIEQFGADRAGRADDRDVVAFSHRQRILSPLSHEEKCPDQHPHFRPAAAVKLKRGRATLRSFPISTSKFGVGTKEGSYQDARGPVPHRGKDRRRPAERHRFQSRLPMSPSAEMLKADDLVMSRILWLDGLEPKNANTYDRYIYIHGTNHEEQIGEPASHGCIRMRNADVAELFDLVPVDTKVVIAAAKPAARRDEKGREKRCARETTCLNDGSNLLGKGANNYMKILKAIMILAIAASALSLGACAQKKETMSTSTGSTSSTYSK